MLSAAVGMLGVESLPACRIAPLPLGSVWVFSTATLNMTSTLLKPSATFPSSKASLTSCTKGLLTMLSRENNLPKTKD